MDLILEKIDKLKSEYEALMPLSDENRKRLDKKFRLEFNYNSNHIEGNTLTYNETELLLIFDETKGGHSMREYEEMKAHDLAFQLVQQWAADTRSLSEADIKNLNKALLVRPYWKDAITPDGQSTRRQILVGEYKQQPNSVRLANGEIFEYTSPLETPGKMEELIHWYKEAAGKSESHPLLLAAMLHYRFVCIHPFDDGNGRVSRLLMNYILFRYGYPPVIIKSAHKTNYLRALNQADAGDTASFISYIGEQLIWSLELSIKAAKGESVEEGDDLDKELAVLQKQLTGNKSLGEKATPQNTADVFEMNLVPLFQLVEEKLEVLKDSFFETDRQIYFSVLDEGGLRAVGSKESKWELIINNWLIGNIRKNNQQITNVKYSYFLKGFKGNKARQTFSLNLEISLNPYNYTITDIPFAYGEPLTKVQMQAILAPQIRSIIEQIKKATQN